MNFKLFLFYVEAYLIEFPLYYLHELSHWILAFTTFLMGINTFPVIEIVRRYGIIINDDNTTSSWSWRMHVKYGRDENNKWLCPLVSCTPVILTILLFTYSPLWMYPVYLSKISTLWLSVGDYRCISDYLFRSKVSEAKN